MNEAGATTIEKESFSSAGEEVQQPINWKFEIWASSPEYGDVGECLELLGRTPQQVEALLLHLRQIAEV